MNMGFFKKTKQERPLFIGFFISAYILLRLFVAPDGTAIFLSYTHAFFLGFAQSLALRPGITRLGVTVAGGIWFGLTPIASLCYSLLLEFFLIVGAVLKIAYEGDTKDLLPQQSVSSVLALICSSILAYMGLELILCMLLTKTFAYFGYYMLVVGWYLLFHSANFALPWSSAR